MADRKEKAEELQRTLEYCVSRVNRRWRRNDQSSYRSQLISSSVIARDSSCDNRSSNSAFSVLDHWSPFLEQIPQLVIAARW